MDLGLPQVRRVCLHLPVLWGVILIIAKDYIHAGEVCNNETFIGKEPLILKSKDFQPCHNTNNVCFLIPATLQTFCNSSSAKYSFNFSSSYGSCTRFNRMKRHECELQPGGLRCEDDQLSLCHAEALYHCLLEITVYVTINSVTAKRFIIEMLQVVKYVKRSSLRVNSLLLKAPSAWKINLTWTRPECEALEYSYFWNWGVTGGLKTHKSIETAYDNSEYPVNDSNIAGLKPYTNYTVCIASRVEVFYEINGPCQTVLTQEARPLAAPMIYNDESEQLDSKKWQSLIKWKNVDKRDWNGNVDKIKILVYKKEDLMPRSISVPVNKSSHLIRSLDTSAEYFVVLELCTHGGCTRSDRRFLALPKEDTPDNAKSVIVLVTILLAFSVMAIIIALCVALRERRKQRPLQDESRDNLVYPVEIPDMIEPVAHNDEHIYEEIQESPYQHIDPNSSSSEGAFNNTIDGDQPIRQIKIEGDLEGASSLRPINTRSLGSGPSTDRHVQLYAPLGACGRHVGHCDCHSRDNAQSIGTEDVRSSCHSMFVVDTIYNEIDRLESSVDDQSDNNELESFQSSLSYENEPLISRDLCEGSDF